MTEAEWLACRGPGPLLDFLGGNASERKLRLFACACCRRLWHLLTSNHDRRAVEVAERFADRLATEDEVTTAFGRLAHQNLTTSAGARHFFAHAAVSYLLPAADGGAAGSAFAVASWAAGADDSYFAAHDAQAALLRDVFGPLAFRPLPRLNPAWLAWEGGTVPKFAASAYEERAFDRLPVLADALEEAGCTEAELLSHLRGPGPHARGCWVLDLLLGKS